jgi:hypothetical protein
MQTSVTGVQYPMVFSVEVTFEDLGNELVIEAPPGFVLLDATLVKRVAFDGTAPSLSIIDSKQVPTVIIPPTDLSSLTPRSVGADSTVRFTEYRSGGKLRILPTSSGLPSTGRADVYIEGVVRGRQNERFGSQYDA